MMLKILKRVERALPMLLESPEQWQSLNINYHHPFVERLWMPWKVDNWPIRVSLHHILPCKREEKVLFHPHPGPLAIKNIAGKYEMEFGVQRADQSSVPKVSMTVIIGEDTSYEMTDPNAFHSVRPLTPQGSYSIMVTGEPWHEHIRRLNPSPPDRSLGPLSDVQTSSLLRTFRFLKFPA